MNKASIAKRSAVIGWAGLVALVGCADYFGDQTMSDGFRVLCRHPVAGPPLILTWAVLTGHLLGLIPERYDPFHQAIVHAKVRTGRAIIRTIECAEDAFDIEL